MNGLFYGKRPPKYYLASVVPLMRTHSSPVRAVPAMSGRVTDLVEFLTTFSVNANKGRLSEGACGLEFASSRLRFLKQIPAEIWNGRIRELGSGKAYES